MGKTPSLRLALLAILFAPLLALVAEAQLTSLTEGSIYRIQNKAYPSLYLTPNSNNVATAQAAIDESADGYLTQYWYVYRVNTAGTNPNYTLRNVGNGKFLKGAGENSNWTLTDAATSACNLYFLTVGTYNTFSTTDSNDGRNKMHAASQKLDDSRNYRVVGWSTDEAPTLWTFTETTNDAATAAVARFALTEKIAEANSYLGNLQVLTPTANGYLFCNDPYLGNNGDYSPQEKGYNLLDGNTGTYFHSNYDSNTKKPLEGQWIRVTYPSGISTFTFKYTNRNTEWNATAHIKTMVVEGSVDDVTYTPIKKYEVADNLPSNALGTYSSDELGSADKVYKYLRFRVTSTHQQNAAFYYIAELSVTRKHISSDESNAISKLTSAINTAKSVLSSDASTAENLSSACLTLTNALDAHKSTMSTIFTAQSYTWAKNELKEQIDILNEEYIGETGFVSARNVGANGVVTYTWRSKYANDASELTELVKRMDNGLTAARKVYDNASSTESAYNTQITKCKDLILEAKTIKYYDYSLPFVLSTADNKVYYSLTEKYGSGYVLQYNDGTNADNKLSVKSITPAEDFLHAEIGNKQQAFYFMKGTEYPRLVVYSYDGRRMCAKNEDLAAGAGKIKFLEEGSDEYNEADCIAWIITENASNPGYFNFNAIPAKEGGSTSLYMGSNNPGNNSDSYEVTSYNIGFFQTPDNDKALFAIYGNKLSGLQEQYKTVYEDYKTHVTKYDNTTPYDKLGYVAHDGTWQSYRQTIDDCKKAVSDNADYTETQLGTLKYMVEGLYSALNMYVPTEATYYTFNSGLSALTAHSLAIDPTTCALSATTGMVKTVDDKTTEHTQALWLITPVPGKDYTVTMQNVHTGLYVQSFAGGTLSMGEQPAEIVLASRDLTTGQFAFTASNYVLTAAEANGAVSAAEQAVTPAANAADCWTATAVTDLTTVQHPVSITSYGKAGFYSSHEVTLPKEVQAWYMKGTTQVDDDRVTRIYMTQVTPEDNGTTILPKETPVLLVTPTAPKVTTIYNLTYNKTAKAAIEGNKLSGVAYSQPVQGGAGTTCYKFGVVDGLAALYPMYQEYNAAGELTAAGTDEGGYIKASANKIYLKILSSGASRLEFRFTDPTTGIEQIITDANATTPANTYYDLQGRRIQGRPAGGIYIVNGVKRIIRR